MLRIYPVKRSKNKATRSTTVEDELIPALPLSTHRAVEMLHDSALYKFMTDIDIDISIQRYVKRLKLKSHGLTKLRHDTRNAP